METMPKKTLVLCRQNVNRSPTAARVLTHKLNEELYGPGRKESYSPQFSINSAGYEIRDHGCTVDWRLNSLMAARGYGTLEGHRPQHLRDEMIEEADLILAMSPKQVSYISRNFPNAKGKIFSLPQYALNDVKSKKEIIDPNRYVLDVIDPSSNARYQLQARIAGKLPIIVSRHFLKTFAKGRVDNRDRTGIDKLFARMVGEIELYSGRAAVRMTKNRKQPVA